MWQNVQLGMQISADVCGWQWKELWKPTKYSDESTLLSSSSHQVGLSGDKFVIGIKICPVLPYAWPCPSWSRRHKCTSHHPQAQPVLWLESDMLSRLGDMETSRRLPGPEQPCKITFLSNFWFWRSHLIVTRPLSLGPILFLGPDPLSKIQASRKDSWRSWS